MDPIGKFIESYTVYSYKENVDNIFKVIFIGIPDIQKAPELKNRCEIVMSRKTYLDHLHRDKYHFYTVEDYLEVLNNPDSIFRVSKASSGNKIQFISKERDVESIGMVVLYTDSLTGIHRIASGFEITKKKFERYATKHKIIWEK